MTQINLNFFFSLCAHEDGGQMPRMNHVWSLSCLKNNVGTIRELKNHAIRS